MINLTKTVSSNLHWDCFLIFFKLSRLCRMDPKEEDFLWNDESCDSKRPFICRRECDTTPPTFLPTVTPTVTPSVTPTVAPTGVPTELQIVSPAQNQEPQRLIMVATLAFIALGLAISLVMYIMERKSLVKLNSKVSCCCVFLSLLIHYDLVGKSRRED